MHNPHNLKAFIYIVPQGCLKTLRIYNMDKLGESDRIIDALAQQIVRNDALIKVIVRFVKHHMEKTEEMSCMEPYLKLQARKDRLINA